MPEMFQFQTRILLQPSV
uniref:Uncharacterized protein n=1 Tax=Anguilla anguilla TaxID=7936 RepID=A0A0E9PTP1_ANGAN